MLLICDFDLAVLKGKQKSKEERERDNRKTKKVWGRGGSTVVCFFFY
jgi:hypothetical protein